MLQWGILGCGKIAERFASSLAKSRSGRLVAVGSSDPARALEFGGKHGLVAAACHGSYDALLADDSVQAVYIATRHPEHTKWAIRAARAGKHILCEKPLAINYAEACLIVREARRAGVLLMEAFMYRCSPQTRKLVELIRSGAIGELRTIQASFSFNSPYSPDSRLYRNEDAGGGILDVGCYPVSFARLLAGAAAGLPFAEPERIEGTARLHPETGADVDAQAMLVFPRGIVAQVSCGVGLSEDNVMRINGTGGRIVVPNPYVPAPDGGMTVIELHQGGKVERLEVLSEQPLYALEADAVADALAAGRVETDAMPVADTLGNLVVLDTWRSQAKLEYAREKPEALKLPFSGYALRVETPGRIPLRQLIPGAAAASQLVFGCDNQRTAPHAFSVFDAFYEAGGTAFDTAYIYMGGACERLLGNWLRQRGVRDSVFIIAKGAHPPFCRPEAIAGQIEESLGRMAIETADLYFMHRDDPSVPVGEFVEALAAQVKAGRIRAYGGSNWSLERTQAANAYADAHGLPRFAALSNQFSLSRMVEPIWGGCLSSNTPEFLRFHEAQQMPIFAWSSQGRGFFTDAARRDLEPTAELARCWYSEDNWARRQRCFELAAKLGAEPIQVALAWVLHQSFPTFALIGPRNVLELDKSLEALKVKLTPEQVRWLAEG
jgi:predicted dehydrogenase/aryl-alcohol dehydrogenase-like predicted oxidoreductase